MRQITFTLFSCLVNMVCYGQGIQTKTIDEGGSGPMKAIAVKEAGAEDFVFYRPKDLNLAHATMGALPLLMWANGGCMDTSAGYERMLTEVASHGYVVMAIGEMEERLDSRKQNSTESSELKRDWTGCCSRRAPRAATTIRTSTR